jgi:hypothetical protein
MLEYWNTGIMGSGKLVNSFIGKSFLTGKHNMRSLLLKSTFQYSTIPLFHQ